MQRSVADLAVLPFVAYAVGPASCVLVGLDLIDPRGVPRFLLVGVLGLALAVGFAKRASP